MSDTTAKRKVVILGSTGSIGTQALEVVDQHPSRFEVLGLAAGGGRVQLFADQIRTFHPQVAAVAGVLPSDVLSPVLDAANEVGCQVWVGACAVTQVSGNFPGSTVLNGINGAVGLSATLAALDAGCILALANKESLVAGGPVVKAHQQFPGQVVPVDSEHSAIAQALLSGTHERGMVSPVITGESEVLELVLTASGGPFRGMSRDQLRDVTVEQALAHPTWAMGPVVTVNSSTLMNKALELIEASLLFDIPAEKIVPVIHPQSMIHSMVTWNDGSTIAQVSYPDMKVPIALGLEWPTHLHSVGVPIDWSKAMSWTFEPVDNQTFPALELARFALSTSGTHPAVLNASNEVCVDAFLAGQLGYLEINNIVGKVTAEHSGIAEPTLADIVDVQEWARVRARELVQRVSS